MIPGSSTATEIFLAATVAAGNLGIPADTVGPSASRPGPFLSDNLPLPAASEAPPSPFAEPASKPKPSETAIHPFGPPVTPKKPVPKPAPRKKPSAPVSGAAESDPSPSPKALADALTIKRALDHAVTLQSAFHSQFAALVAHVRGSIQVEEHLSLNALPLDPAVPIASSLTNQQALYRLVANTAHAHARSGGPLGARLSATFATDDSFCSKVISLLSTGVLHLPTSHFDQRFGLFKVGTLALHVILHFLPRSQPSAADNALALSRALSFLDPATGTLTFASFGPFREALTLAETRNQRLPCLEIARNVSAALDAADTINFVTSKLNWPHFVAETRDYLFSDTSDAVEVSLAQLLHLAHNIELFADAFAHRQSRLPHPPPASVHAVAAPAPSPPPPELAQLQASVAGLVASVAALEISVRAASSSPPGGTPSSSRRSATKPVPQCWTPSCPAHPKPTHSICTSCFVVNPSVWICPTCRLDNSPGSVVCQTQGCGTSDAASRKIDPTKDQALIAELSHLALDPNALHSRRLHRSMSSARPLSVFVATIPLPTHAAQSPPQRSHRPIGPTPSAYPHPTVPANASPPKPTDESFRVPAVVLADPSTPFLLSEGFFEQAGFLISKHHDLNILISPRGCIVPLLFNPTTHRLFVGARLQSTGPGPVRLVLGSSTALTCDILIQLDDAADISIVPPSLASCVANDGRPTCPVAALGSPSLPSVASGHLTIALSADAPQQGRPHPSSSPYYAPASPPSTPRPRYPRHLQPNHPAQPASFSPPRPRRPPRRVLPRFLLAQPPSPAPSTASAWPLSAPPLAEPPFHFAACPSRPFHLDACPSRHRSPMPLPSFLTPAPLPHHPHDRPTPKPHQRHFPTPVPLPYVKHFRPPPTQAAPSSVIRGTRSTTIGNIGEHCAQVAELAARCPVVLSSVWRRSFDRRQRGRAFTCEFLPMQQPLAPLSYRPAPFRSSASGDGSIFSAASAPALSPHTAKAIAALRDPKTDQIRPSGPLCRKSGGGHTKGEVQSPFHPTYPSATVPFLSLLSLDRAARPRSRVYGRTQYAK